MKRKLFIGSSTEGLNIAKHVKAFFEDAYDCHIWNEDVFSLNKNTLDSLLKAAYLYDYAIMVWTSDDIALIRDNLKETARDNVLFEHGLFLGSMGTGKAYVLCESGVNILTDLMGITVSFFDTETIGDKKVAKDEIDKTLEVIKDSMQSHASHGFLNMLPSTSLALGYYSNCVKRICDWIVSQGEKFVFEGTEYNSALLNIVRPSSIDDNMFDRSVIYYRSIKTDKKILPVAAGRNINVMANTSKSDEGNTLMMYEMPTTLSGIRQAVNLCFPQNYVGTDKDREYVEAREIENFFLVLQYLVMNNTVTKTFVKFINE